MSADDAKAARARISVTDKLEQVMFHAMHYIKRSPRLNGETLMVGDVCHRLLEVVLIWLLKLPPKTLI
jgi:hypothetical protein